MKIEQLYNWNNERTKFKLWYLKLGIREVNELELEKASLKIEQKENPIDETLIRIDNYFKAFL